MSPSPQSEQATLDTRADPSADLTVHGVLHLANLRMLDTGRQDCLSDVKLPESK